MSLNWNNIRPLNNSLNDGFEELVCQLARKEKYKSQKKFYRIGRPDGGKECYWQFENNEIYAWQAKYFTNSLSEVQWSQIHKSVISAIDNHSKLVRYFLAVPLDMPDAKVSGKKSMLTKWEEKIIMWKEYAKKRKKNIEFTFWGSHELIELLSKNENEGLKYFWFNQNEFSDEWFNHKNSESINALGSRYSSTLNFKLEIAKIFNGLSRNSSFEEENNLLFDNLLNSHFNISKINIEILEEYKEELSRQINIFQLHYNAILFTDSSSAIPINQLTDFLNSFLIVAQAMIYLFYELEESERKELKKDPAQRSYSFEIDKISEFINTVDEIKNYLKSTECVVANQPFLLITGDAGMGKSHLLADIVEHRKKENLLSLFLLGEDFTTKETPWTQILNNKLRINDLDELGFLSAINAKAESKKSRIVFFIDAINEGEGRIIWQRRLKSFIESIRKYKWLGLVISLRNSYVDLIANEDVIDETIITRIEHKGFLGHEYDASNCFFKYYGIVQPNSPLLNPEFQNPLFLKLFCKSLSDKGLTEIPAGYEGLTTIIKSFLDGINIKLSNPLEFDYDERKQLVQKAVRSVLNKLIENGKDYIEYEEADEIIDILFKGNCTNREQYLKRLISEGVFNIDLFWNTKGESYEVIIFGYQRFQDYMMASLLLEKYLDINDPLQSFKEGPLFEILKDEDIAQYNQNLIEALSIQLPEMIQKELFELAPYAKLFYPIAEGYISSLIWRRTNCITKNSESYINDIIFKNEVLFNKFLDTVVSTSMKIDFHFNAKKLHSFLRPLSLSDRDFIWTTWLQNQYEDINSRNSRNNNSVKRLIDWAWSEDDKMHIGDQHIYLGCITLGWFLSSSNRFLRDAATKSLVCLLQKKIHIMIALLKEFKDVNDPYITERLYAVAYGCVLRSDEISDITHLSEYVYENVFNGEEVYPHILLRDYARGIIEISLSRNLISKIDLTKIRPPYRSQLLPKQFPSVKEIDKKYKPKGQDGHYGKKLWGNSAILDSMTTEYGRGIAHYGDFGRYTFQSAFDDWEIDVIGLSNYAVEKIFEMGYDSLKFSEFDCEQGSGRGGSGYKERIGKKYQWIVFHELLARVSDQCNLKDESSWGATKEFIAYEGPWYPYVRDIDPSLIIRETLEEKYKNYSKSWRYMIDYNSWNISSYEWVLKRDDLPKIPDIIEIVDDLDKEWLWLNINPSWYEPENFNNNDRYSQRKCITYYIESFFIQNKDLVKFKTALKKDNYSCKVPRVRRLHTIFNREYYWSPAFNFFNKRYYGGEKWIDLYGISEEEKIASVHRTTECFNWENGIDCSKKTAIQFYKPTQIIKEGLDLKISCNEGEFVNEMAETICLDPSVNNKSIGGLLIQKDKLQSWLNENELSLIWIAYGEKMIIARDWIDENYPGRLNISSAYILQQKGIVELGTHFNHEKH